MQPQTACRAAGLAIALLLAGCATTQRVGRIDVSVGENIDRPTGYFAYATGLPAVSAADVAVAVAAESRLCGRRLLIRADTCTVYPRAGLRWPRDYVRPAQLARLLDVGWDAPGQTASDTLELGYFMKELPIQVRPHGDPAPGPIRNLFWIPPTADLESAIRDAVAAMREVAAREGGERIVDLSVFLTAANPPYGPYSGYGAFISGRVVTTGRVEEPPAPQAGSSGLGLSW